MIILSITLTDEAEVFDRKEQLEETYDHILEIRIDNERTRRKCGKTGGKIEVPDPFEAFGLFYEAVRHCPMTKEQREMMYKVIEEAKGRGGGQMKIGEFARVCNVTKDTVRYYVNIGLLIPKMQGQPDEL